MNLPSNAKIQWNEEGQPIATEFDDVYFSKKSGLDESEYVFIKHNRLFDRWKTLKNRTTFTIFETGFGTGLNFLTAWRLWQKSKPHNCSAHFHFISAEKFPLTKSDLAQALQLWPELKPLCEQLIDVYQLPSKGFHRFHFSHNTSLTLIVDDATTALQQLAPIQISGPTVQSQDTNLSGFDHKGLFDAIFLDGFAPSKNPSMWSPDLFEGIAKLSHQGTTFSTFTAAGFVRRGLTTAGFTCQKTAGFGHKRELIHGRFNALPQKPEPPRKQWQPSWHLTQATTPIAKNIAIIGGGLSGTHTAHALANKGFQVTVFEQQELASGASGNPQGALYTKLSDADGPLAQFNLFSFLYAVRHYQQLGEIHGSGKNQGLLQLAYKEKLDTTYQAIAARYGDIASYLSVSEASSIAGVTLNHGALHFPTSGWLQPKHLCKTLCEHKNIQLIKHTLITQLEYNPIKNMPQPHAAWQLTDKHNHHHAFDGVVIACANTAKRFELSKRLPTKSIRGQITTAPATVESSALNAVICAEGYIAPPLNGAHCLGATFTLNNSDPTANEQDTQINLHNAAEISPAFSKLQSTSSGQRVSFRCTTPDYLPIIGPAPNEESMIARFAKYRQNFKHPIDQPGDYWPGCFLNLGHGSRGLTYTPICAEIIASLFTGSTLPIPTTLFTHIHSARFLMRDLARNRI